MLGKISQIQLEMMQTKHEILFADDTLILDEHSQFAEVYMRCIQRQCVCYGLALNWDKIIMLCINCSPNIMKLDSNFIRASESMIYLGGLISNDRSIVSELSRRIGIAQSEFVSLQRVWSHANITN